MNTHNRIPLQKSAIDRTLDHAVERIYEIYGSDLTPFFAAVQQQRIQQLQEASEMRKDDATRDEGTKASL